MIAASVAMVMLCVTGCQSPPRVNRVIDDGWRFTPTDAAGAEAIGFDDHGWQSIKLPHTWNALDGQDGGDNYRRGPAWYRRILTVPAGDGGKCFFLRFEGAATVTDVFVNGQQAGSHRGNFAAFCFDVTDLIKPGADNVVAVRVDNSEYGDVPPLSGDFTIFGGLYRDVHLLILDPLSISPIDDASSGTYFKQTQRADGSVELDVTTKLRNASNDSKTASVVCEIAELGGRIVESGMVKQSVAARGVADAVVHLRLDHPHLWNGRSDPYLYRGTITVRDGSRVTDVVSQLIGIRSFRVDPDQGFMLNGSRYPLHGVNRHQDRPGKGWAVDRSDHEADFRIIAEMGCTGVRLAHFQQADVAYELCDRLGLVTWAECGLVNDITHTTAFSENAKQQLRELIKQNYNHPSIVCWSLYNELALAKPEFADEQHLVSEMNDLAHALDPDRLTTAATHKQKVDHPVNWIPDVTAFNRYYGWYEGKPGDWGASLDALREKMPGKCIGISEYGAGASIFQHEADPTKPKTGGPWHPEEWQGVVHEAAWKAMKDRPWLWGTFAWVMFDFAADARHEGDVAGRNDKGLVTADRKTKKDAFYFYQANWTQTPVLHITAGRFNPRPTGEIAVKVYSNCESVELFLNGRTLGRKSGDDRVLVWPGVVLREGRNEMRARGMKGGKLCEDVVVWTATRSAATRLSVSATPEGR